MNQILNIEDTYNTEVEENIKYAFVPWMESFGTKETFDKVITAIDSLHRRVAELESLAYVVAVDIDSEGKIITHQQLQKAREDAYQAGRAYEAQQCRGSSADNHPNAPYDLPELYPWKDAFNRLPTKLPTKNDHSELDQDNK